MCLDRTCLFACLFVFCYLLIYAQLIGHSSETLSITSFVLNWHDRSVLPYLLKLLYITGDLTAYNNNNSTTPDIYMLSLIRHSMDSC